MNAAFDLLTSAVAELLLEAARRRRQRIDRPTVRPSREFTRQVADLLRRLAAHPADLVLGCVSPQAEAGGWVLLDERLAGADGAAL